MIHLHMLWEILSVILLTKEVKQLQQSYMIFMWINEHAGFQHYRYKFAVLGLGYFLACVLDFFFFFLENNEPVVHQVF